MKIAIVGAGIGGLSTYLFLKDRLPHPPAPLPSHEIIIYEKYPAPRRKSREAYPAERTREEQRPASVLGAGLGIAPNGMRILRILDPEIHDAVLKQGYPVARFRIASAHNSTIGSMPCMHTDKGGVPEMMVMSSRQGMWDCLRDKVPDEALITGKKVQQVIKGQGTERPALKFTDGSTLEYDLIVGADGVNSTVKKAVLGDGLQDDYPPTYKGLVGVGGFVPTTFFPPLLSKTIQPPPFSPVVMTFGPNGFFGYGPCTSPPTTSPLSKEDIQKNVALPLGPQGMWWSTYHQDAVPAKRQSIDKEAIRRQLIDRHGEWQDPVIRKLVAEGDIDVGVAQFVTPKLPTWIADRVVLLGDAAHALPSTSGQGTSQALEDALALSMLLAHSLSLSQTTPSNPPSTSSNHSAIQSALQNYVAVRKPRVERILDNANRMNERKGKQGVVAEWVTYGMMWVLCKFASGILTRELNHSVDEEVERIIASQHKS